MSLPPEVSTTPVRRRRRVKGTVARNLRGSAERIIATERLENVTIRRLVQEVGCSSPNFYNHYQSLDHLLCIIAAAGYDQLSERTARTFSSHEDKPAALAAAAEACIDFYARNRELARLMFRLPGASGCCEYRVAADRLFSTLAGSVRGAQSRPEDDEPAVGPAEFGVGHGFFALWYGVAVAATEGLLKLDLTDKRALAGFMDVAVRPFLDSCPAQLVVPADPDAVHATPDREVG